MKLSLIIPCYNEEEALPYIYEELVKVSATLSDYEIEYLFVNDGSKDHTLDKLKELAKSSRSTIPSKSCGLLPSWPRKKGIVSLSTPKIKIG